MMTRFRIGSKIVESNMRNVRSDAYDVKIETLEKTTQQTCSLLCGRFYLISPFEDITQKLLFSGRAV